MNTRIYKNHYGLNAESEDGTKNFHTMRVHSGEVVTSLNLESPSKTEGVRIYSPTSHRVSAGRIPMLTAKKLKEAHESNTKKLQESL